MTPLRIDAAARAVIEAASLAAYPREACGLLIGTAGAHGVVRRAPECRNVAPDADRFELHPEDFLAAETQADALGLTVMGAWHSHVDVPAQPSERDRAGAWAGWSHVICGVDATAARSLRSWRLVDGEFVEQPIAD